MTTTDATAPDARAATAPGHARDAARATGLAYLALAVTGMLSFLLIRAQLYVPGDAAATAANLVGNELLARLGIVLELGLVTAQALTALWFFRLFRPVDSFAAGALAAFGLVNSVVILVGAAFSTTALQVAIGGDAATALLLYDLHGSVWAVGSVFFGLWLIPMGWLTVRSGTMPRVLGWILVISGVGYLLSAFAAQLAPGLPALAEVLAAPATVGEFWMIGYLLLRGGTAPTTEQRT